ncbi:hypothetical protein ARZXY2_1047 [Arthrobacter sp. ZXY-2]|nr:hypothetical protein ARZXY2_1047 [Arthrobacter sp. ZXY-2]
MGPGKSVRSLTKVKKPTPFVKRQHHAAARSSPRLLFTTATGG